MTTSLLQIIGAFLQLALLLGKILQQRQLLAKDHANELNAILAESQRILLKVQASRADVRGSPGDDEFDMDGPRGSNVASGTSSASSSTDNMPELLPSPVSLQDGQSGHDSTAPKE